VTERERNSPELAIISGENSCHRKLGESHRIKSELERIPGSNGGIGKIE
jgi:hypothetical protein